MSAMCLAFELSNHFECYEPSTKQNEDYSASS